MNTFSYTYQVAYVESSLKSTIKCPGRVLPKRNVTRRVAESAKQTFAQVAKQPPHRTRP